MAVTDRERAKQYIAIFIGAGDRWEFYIPVDADRTPTGIRLGTVEIGPDPDELGAWFLNDGETVKRYRKAPEPTEVPA